MLADKLELHNVDAEALCARVLREHARRSQLELRPAQWDDALAYLLAEAWQAAEAYEPAHGLAFSTFAYRRLRQRLVDHVRTTNGRTVWKFRDHVYERPRPVVLSLDAPDAHGDPLGATLPDGGGDAAADRDPDDVDGLLAQSVLHADRDRATLREAAARRAA